MMTDGIDVVDLDETITGPCQGAARPVTITQRFTDDHRALRRNRQAITVKGRSTRTKDLAVLSDALPTKLAETGTRQKKGCP